MAINGAESGDNPQASPDEKKALQSNRGVESGDNPQTSPDARYIPLGSSPILKKALQSNRVKIGGVVAVVASIALIIGIPVGIATSGSGSSGQRVGLDVIPNGDISFSLEDSSSYESYVQKLKEAVKPYENAELGEKFIDCNDAKKPTGDQVCIFEVNELDNCYTSNTWGFSDSSPCVLLTFHNDTSFKPEVYKSTGDLPSFIPTHMNRTIQTSSRHNGGILPRRVWLYCTKGEYYFPYEGFAEYYFPNRDVDHYLPPLVAVSFSLGNPGIVEVECSIWSILDNEVLVAKRKFTIERTA